MLNSIYLDNNSSSQVLSDVTKEMLTLLEVDYGNPSSIHFLGLKAKEALEISRQRVSKLLGCKPQNIVFTTGGTESNNLAIKGFAENLTGKRHFITSSVEHPSVLQVFRHIENMGHKVTYLKVDAMGLISPEQIEDAIENDTALISIMLANNETGVLFPISEIGKLAKKHKIYFHCDAVQGVGRVPINVNELNVDFLSISAHKFHGPKGAGALFVRQIDSIKPLILGGKQENGKRSGTESLPAIAGMGKACEIALSEMEYYIPQISFLRDRLENEILKAIPGSVVNGSKVFRLCNTTNICFPGINSRMMIEELSKAGLFISHSSACLSYHNESSHVLKAMGLSDQEISSSLRFSLSKKTTLDEIDRAVKILSQSFGNIANTPACRCVNDTQEYLENEIKSSSSYYSILSNDLENIWAQTTGDPRISIAIIDGPVDTSHVSFENSLITTVNAFSTDSVGNEMSTIHGTHVASIILGQHNSELRGIAPNCRGILIPVFSDNTKGPGCSQLNLASAITKAVQEGAHIINISGGQLAANGESDEHLSRAVRLCEESGVLIIAAAGNEGCDCLHIPAALPSVLAVGAMDAIGNPINSSNWGLQYQSQGILAPGNNILGALPGGGLSLKSGTSFATAIVTGVVALLLSLQLKSQDKFDTRLVKKALLNSALPCDNRIFSNCERFLAGKINIIGAKKLLNNKTTGGIKMDFGNSTDINPVFTESFQLDNLDKSREISLSSCGGNNSKPSYVYAIGQIGYDFGVEPRRDFFVQMNVENPNNSAAMLNYLEKQPWQADSLIWTLNQDMTPIYALKPIGAFSAEAYKLLREFLASQIGPEMVERVSIPGIILGSTTLLSGQVVPVVAPVLRGMYSWSTSSLLKAVMGKEEDNTKQKIEGIANFLERIYYEIRNLGMSSQERAMNFAATNAYQVEKVFESAVNEGMSLDSIDIEKSPICRSGSDCWDIKLIFFNPTKRTEQARRVYRFTIDVSDIVPITVGKTRSWYIY